MSSSVPTTASRSFCANEDYRFYLEKLKQACDTHDRDLHAYVLMTNHVHLLITPNQGNSLSKATQMLGRYYIQYLNGIFSTSTAAISIPAPFGKVVTRPR